MAAVRVTEELGLRVWVRVGDGVVVRVGVADRLLLDVRVGDWVALEVLAAERWGWLDVWGGGPQLCSAT